MSKARSDRLSKLAELLRSQRHTRQDELVGALRDLGYEVTQATVSRDLEQLGAVKLRQSGETRYALPEPRPFVAGEERLRRLFGDWVRQIVPAANLLVLKTPPGSAHLVGVALDAAEFSEVAGTICGDDTIFVACASEQAARRLSDEWAAWLAN